MSSIVNRDFSPELIFSAARSSGPGGQNVNKVNTKVELRFNVMASALLSEEEKMVVLDKLRSRITIDGDLIVVSQTERSQLKNKQLSIEKFYKLLTVALTPRKKRKPTSPSRSSVEKRLQLKKIHAERKSLRRRLDSGHL